jgi:hypothetical protein
MNNSEFLEVLKQSFLIYQKTSARSNEKLKILHGEISNDLVNRIKRHNDTGDIYTVSSLGYANGKEMRIEGRYIDKTVDIAIEKNNEVISGIAVKFVMSNYKQNANNYFENMLGETANIRCKRIPYFQILIIPEKLPYFDKSGNITKWEFIEDANIKKYIVLSTDNPETYMHTPDITLLCIARIEYKKILAVNEKTEYADYCVNNEDAVSVEFSNRRINTSNGVIYNDYEQFIRKVAYKILSL